MVSTTWYIQVECGWVGVARLACLAGFVMGGVPDGLALFNTYGFTLILSAFLCVRNRIDYIKSFLLQTKKNHRIDPWRNVQL